MADFKMSHAVLVFAVIGLYNVSVIHLAEANIESKEDILDYLVHGGLKQEIADIKDTLRNIQNDKTDHASGDGIQRLVNEVKSKTKAMIRAFSKEKKQLRRQRKYLTEALGVIRVSVDDHENRTRDLVDQMKDNYQFDFEQLINKTELVRQQSQQKCDSVQQLVETQLMNNTEQALDVIRVSIDDHKNHSRDLVDQMKDNHQVDFEQLMTQIEFGRQQRQQMAKKLSADIDSIKSNVYGIPRMNSMKAAMHCTGGWKRQLDSCVLFVTERKTWFDAQGYCKEHGGFLVEPYSSDAVALLMEEAKRTGGAHSGWWIGARDHIEEGVWRWESTGRKIGIVPKLVEYLLSSLFLLYSDVLKQ